MIRNAQEDISLTKIASASIRLSKIAPELHDISVAMEQNARKQAADSMSLAHASEALIDVMEQTMTRLEHSSGAINDVVDSLRATAMKTKILALNVCVEASRFNFNGSAFDVVAREISDLAEHTGSSAETAHDTMCSMHQSMDEMFSAAGVRDAAKGAPPGENHDQLDLSTLKNHLCMVADRAQEHTHTAQTLSENSGLIRQLSEELLLSAGRFRMPAHYKAQRIFRTFISAAEIMTLHRGTMEAFLRNQLVLHPFFELFYVTDSLGLQITENIWSDAERDGSEALGKNWSARPWFRDVKASREICISNIYRSVATDNFCFTISGPILVDGLMKGVIAADINFASLLTL